MAGHTHLVVLADLEEGHELGQGHGAQERVEEALEGQPALTDDAVVHAQHQPAAGEEEEGGKARRGRGGGQAVARLGMGSYRWYRRERRQEGERELTMACGVSCGQLRLVNRL